MTKIVWDSKENRCYVVRYFILSIIFLVMVLASFFASFFADWNNSGTRFDMQDIFSFLFFSMFMTLFGFLSYCNLKSAYKTYKYNGQIVLTLYNIEDVINSTYNIDSGKVVFADKNGFVTCESKDLYDVLTTIYSLNSFFDFLELCKNKSIDKKE